MKKIIIAALAMFMATGANAKGLDYEPEEGLTWQVQAGMNVSNITGSHMSAKVGANLGAYGQYMFPNAHGTFLNFGLNYGMKGAGNSNDWINHGITSHYISLPLHIGFQYNFIPELGAYVDFGPYVAVGVGGRNSIDFKDDVLVDYHTYLFGSSYNDYAAIDKIGTHVGFDAFDWGLGFRVGVEYNQHYSINFGFDWGLYDLPKANYRKVYKELLNQQLPKWKNFNCAITLGYRF